MYPHLKTYLQNHTCITPTDLIKFYYQSVMGPGHMAPAREVAEGRLSEEIRASGPLWNKDRAVELLEGDAARLDVGCGLSASSQAALFCLSAEAWTTGSTAQVLDMIGYAAARYDLPFSRDALDAALDAWQQAGCPAVSHSDAYKSANRAHYRVIHKKYLPFLDILKKIEQLPTPAIVAIDGMCGSGKSTLGETLAHAFRAPLVHMDDFFLPFERKTKSRMSEPGGNVDYERFTAEFLVPYCTTGRAEYGVYKCHLGRIDDTKRVENSPLVIVEGSYSLNPHIPDFYDLKIFVETDPLTQQQRIKNREGDDGLLPFIDRWIPMENKYFDHLAIRKKCDIIVRT